MADFDHFILTRFNVGLYSRKPGDVKVREIFDNDKWMEHRFELFDAFCFPSVMGQANQNFRWLVFFDSNTPEKFRGKIESYRLSYDKYIPVFHAGEYFKHSQVYFAADFIMSIKTPGAEYIITTRLDCDDSLGVKAVDCIQKNFDFQKNTPLNLLQGYIYDLMEDRIYRASYDTNPFISLVEKVRKGKVMTIWKRTHGEWLSRRQAGEGPLWLMVIHGVNLCNTIMGEETGMSLEDVAGDFSLDAEAVRKAASRITLLAPAPGGDVYTATSFAGSRSARYSIFKRIYQSRYVSMVRLFFRYNVFRRRL